MSAQTRNFPPVDGYVECAYGGFGEGGLRRSRTSYLTSTSYGVYRNQSTTIFCGNGVPAGGVPAQLPSLPIAKLRMANMGLSYTQVAPSGSEAGVNTAVVMSSTPMVIMSGERSAE